MNNTGKPVPWVSVVPQTCVQGRIFRTDIVRPGELTITEYVIPSSFRLCTQKSAFKAERIVSEIEETYTFPLPVLGNGDRLLGSLRCIGSRENLLVIQFMTAKCKYTQFMLVDIIAGTCQQLQDIVHYFHRDMCTCDTIECHISPDQTTALFRLPQSIRSPGQWSKILLADLKKCVNPGPGGSTELPPVIEDPNHSILRDKKTQMLAFDPRQRVNILFALMDEFAQKLKFTNYNVYEKRVIRHTDIIVDRDSDYKLKACDMSFYQSGEAVILIIWKLSVKSSSVHVLVYVVNSDNLKVLHRIPVFYLSGKEKHLNRSFVYDCVLAPCDSSLFVPLDILQIQNNVCYKPIILPKVLCLKNLCRKAILRNVSKKKLIYLPLPNALIKYVMYKFL